MSKHVEKPIPGPDCFAEKSSEAALSQAAVLLLIGERLRGAHLLQDMENAPVGRATLWRALRADLESFPVPAIDARKTRVHTAQTRMQLNTLSPKHFTPLRAKQGALRAPVRILGVLAKQAYESASQESAAQLLEACLSHSNEIVRVAAAASLFELATEVKPLIEQLARSISSKDRLTRAVAATALARIDPEHAALRPLTAPRRRSRTARRARTGMLIHGTWARNDPWWQPGGDFHSYIRGSVWPDLYGAPDRFEWSGGYSDAARSIAAKQLADWIERKSAVGIKLMAHSHGANVAMLASQLTDKIGKLVLLSCPVHEDKYLPDFARTPDVVSIRVKLDLVILADGGGQKFSEPRIRENVLPVWFEHAATHDPDCWRKYKVSAML